MFQWLRSLIFTVQMYLMMAVIGIGMLPLALWKQKYVYLTVHTYCRWVMWTAGWMVGLKTEFRGKPPTEEALVAAKHQSFLDVMMIASQIPQPKYIMKSSLIHVPVLGWFGKLTGSVPVERGKRAEAIKQMMDGVKSGKVPGGQLVIYPQGTRVAPGDHKPYKVGSAVLYTELGQRCYPVACNVGVFWPRYGILKKPGTAVIEFLDPIEQGLEKNAFMSHLEDVVETRSKELMRDAGFKFD